MKRVTRLSFFDVMRLKVAINTTIDEIKKFEYYPNSEEEIKKYEFLRDKLEEGYIK